MSGIRIEVTRSGGFGGLSLPPMTLATADLAPDATRELIELVDAVEQAPPPTTRTREMPDAMHYDLTITREGRVRRLSFDDTSVPPDVRPLLDRVASQGRPRLDSS